MGVYIVRRETKTRGVRWHVRFEQSRNERIVHLGVFASEAEARTRAIAAREVAARGELPTRLRIPDRSITPTLIGDAAKAWLGTLVDLAPGTILNYERTVRDAPAWLLAIQPGEVTHLEVQRWVGEMSGRLARGTIERELIVLRQVLDYAGVTVNPVSDRRVRLPRRQRKTYRLPTRAQIEALHLALPSRVELMVLLEHTGLRIGEAAALRWRDIDYARDRLLVADSKTPAGRRWVERLAGDPAFPERGEQDQSERVFSPSPHSLTSTIWQLHHRVGTPLISAHDFRHLAASRWLHDGVLSPAQIAERLGHADPGVTLRVYSHVVPPD